MGASSAHDDAADWFAASVARFVLAIIYAEMVLVFALRIDPINAGAIVLDGEIKCVANTAPKFFYVVGLQRIAVTFGMNLGAVQRLVGVDVAHPGKQRLIE